MKNKTLIKALALAGVMSLSLGFTNVNAITSSTITVTNVSGYEEGLGVLFNKTGESSITASYKLDGTSNYINIDSELIREVDSGYRLDVLGLAEGLYDILIETSDGASALIDDISVSRYDRSGYAHFKTIGVGAYNDDGTLKDNTVVVYVSDETKNTVTATIAGTTYTGLSNIIKAQKDSSVPLDIRILDEIQAQQWAYINDKSVYGTGETPTRNSNIDAVFSDVDWEATSEKQAYSSSNYKIGEEDIISYGINTLSSTGVKYDEDGNSTTINNITYLDGLTNVINWAKEADKDTGLKEYDSYYNELDVRGASNITIEGVGDNAGIFQWGFCFNQCNSVEVRNLEFSSYPEDAIGIQGGKATDMDYHGFFIHHNTFNQGVNNWDITYESDKHEGDGSTDFKFAYDLTISYCRYNKTHKTALIGSGSSSYQYNVTFHHNYYYKCESRLPYTRNTNFHIYNCYYYGSTGTNMQIYNTAYAFIESCYFENTNKTFTTSNNGVIKLFNNTVNSSSSTAASTSVVYASTRDEVVSNTCTDNSSGYTWSGTDYSSFDTDSNLFYYDQENNKTDAERMDEVEDLPTIIPTLAGFAIGQSNLSEYIEEGVPALYYSSQSGTYTDSDNEYVYYCVFNKITNLSLEDVANMSIEYVVSVTLNNNTYSKTYNMNTVYTSLRMKGEVIPGAEEEDNTYYFYFLLNEITSSYNGASIVITANVYINDKLYTKTASEYIVNIIDESDVEGTTYILFDEVTETVTESTEFTGYTINATSGKTVTTGTISNSGIVLNETTVTRYIDLGGVGALSYRNIELDITSNARITVYYSANATRYLGLYNSSYTLLEQSNGTTGSSNILSYTYDTISSGKYYIASTGSGIKAYAIVIEYI